MKVLLVGSGGREDALAWKIAQSPLVEKIYCAPGNAGISRRAECLDIGVNDFDALVAVARQFAIDLTVVGPEDPLSRGIVDRFVAEGLRVFGPTAGAAQIESSKSFAKRLMVERGIPTAAYAEFDDAAAAMAYVREHGAPIVVKANGLAAGKGVTVATDVASALEAIEQAMVKRVFGDAGASVVLEECLVGEEASILALSDGRHVIPLAPSQDHKPVFDGDRGPNTGGMGAYSPAPIVTAELLEQVEQTILRPCIEGMADEGTPMRGILYAGLMITREGPKVIEFNCRFGDPETQVVLPRMKSDIVPLLMATADGSLEGVAIEWHDVACVTVVMASGGYPGSYSKGKPISGIEEAESDRDVVVFHAGTAYRDGQLVTNGGRVLNVTATAPRLEDAVNKAYRAVSRISFEGAHWRSDIAGKALRF